MMHVDLMSCMSCMTCGWVEYGTSVHVSGGRGTGGVPNGPAGTRRTRRRQILEAHLAHLDPCCLAILATERGLPPLSPFRLRGENALLSSRKSPFNTASAGSFAVGRGANLQGIWMDLAWKVAHLQLLKENCNTFENTAHQNCHGSASCNKIDNVC